MYVFLVGEVASLVVAKRAHTYIFRRYRVPVGWPAPAIYGREARILISPPWNFFFNWRNGIQTNQLIAKNPIFFGISIVTLAPVPRFSGPCPLPKTNNRLRMIVCLALAE